MPKFYAVGTEPDVGVALFEFESNHERRSFFRLFVDEAFERYSSANPKGKAAWTWSGLSPHAWEGPISSDAKYRDVLPVPAKDAFRLQRRFDLPLIRKEGQLESWVMGKQEEFRAKNPLRALAAVGV